MSGELDFAGSVVFPAREGTKAMTDTADGAVGGATEDGPTGVESGAEQAELDGVEAPTQEQVDADQLTFTPHREIWLANLHRHLTWLDGWVDAMNKGKGLMTLTQARNMVEQQLEEVRKQLAKSKDRVDGLDR